MLYAVPLTVSWTVAGVHIALGLAAFFAIVHGALARAWPLIRTPADLPFIAFALASVLAAVFAVESASNPWALKKLLLIPAVHLTATALGSVTRARCGLRLYVIALTVTALVATLLFVTTPHEPWARLRSTTHYMTFSGLLLLAWPLAAAAAWGSRGRLRSAYWLATAVLLFALLLTQTRSAWLGSVVAACVLLARYRRRLLLLVPLAIIVAVPLLPQSFRARAASSFDPQFHSNADRLNMWRVSFEMWRDHPWTGVGLGDLQHVYREYTPPDAERSYGHMHNNWIHILTTTGVIGLLAFAWLMVACGRMVWRAGVPGPDPELWALGAGGWGSFWGFHTMGLFEWNFGDVEVTIAFYFLIGVLFATARIARASSSAKGANA
jgi:O-antigen ligase